ncbi:hypothetical protein JEM65_19790 [Gelidibacter salicanalis]|uniref:Uncharacterized protein n=1 Tax=Gelidibacter salicanalis TaxID=291193 RepID=A0A934KX26_9FLAO|nr:hypothetical protein [Gelidibacter salicanalis]
MRVSGNKKYKSAFSHFGITFAGVDPIWINGVNPVKLKMETQRHFGLSVSGNKKYKSAFSHFGITFAGVDPIWINGVNPVELKWKRQAIST